MSWFAHTRFGRQRRREREAAAHRAEAARHGREQHARIVRDLAEHLRNLPPGTPEQHARMLLAVEPLHSLVYGVRSDQGADYVLTAAIELLRQAADGAERTR